MRSTPCGSASAEIRPSPTAPRTAWRPCLPAAPPAPVAVQQERRPRSDSGRLVAGGARQRAVAGSGRGVAAVAEAGQRHPQQRHVALRALGRPHGVAARVGAHQHVQVAVAALQERELVDRAPAHAQRAGAEPSSGMPVEHPSARPPSSAPHLPVAHPHVHGRRGDVEHAPRGAPPPPWPCSQAAALEVAHRHRVQRQLVAGAHLARRAVDARGRAMRRNSPSSAPLCHRRRAGNHSNGVLRRPRRGRAGRRRPACPSTSRLA
jgi:hypothetical protein